MWNRLLQLCLRSKRPLVFVDFETAGLDGKPPVEFAIAYWAPWMDPVMDETSVQARAVAPPGLTYAATGRLDPGVPIDAEAQEVHGISAADLKGCPSYRDLDIIASFRSLANGDPSAGEGPAVWAGHNLAESDIPWSQSWGYLPPGHVDCIDTMRLQRRLNKDMSMPPAPDAVGLAGPWGWTSPPSYCPAIVHGLAPYAASLAGLHTALFGEPATGAHGALADTLASARCLAGLLDLWIPIFHGPCSADDPNAALAAVLAEANRPRRGLLSVDGWLKVNRDTGAKTWAKGKHEGLPFKTDRGYAEWVAALPSSPTGINGKAWCSAETREAMFGKPLVT